MFGAYKATHLRRAVLNESASHAWIDQSGRSQFSQELAVAVTELTSK